MLGRCACADGVCARRNAIVCGRNELTLLSFVAYFYNMYININKNAINVGIDFYNLTVVLGVVVTMDVCLLTEIVGC